MKLQDYAPYYIGCRCINTWFPEGHKEYNKGWVLSGYCQLYDNGGKPFFLESENEVTWTDSIKLILRKLEDITNEECEMYNQIFYTMHSINKVQDQMKTGAALTDYLLKTGFDLFGLIEAGLAIDSKTLK